MSEIQSAEEFVNDYMMHGWTLQEKANSIRARDKAIVERIREKIDAHGMITRQWQLNNILDAVLRELGGEQNAWKVSDMSLEEHESFRN